MENVYQARHTQHVQVHHNKSQHLHNSDNTPKLTVHRIALKISLNSSDKTHFFLLKLLQYMYTAHQ